MDWTWCERGGHVVWGNGGAARNLGAVLIRRLMEAEKNNEPMPLGSPFPVALTDIADFLKERTDDTKLEELLWGLSLVAYENNWGTSKSKIDAELPRAYALMKLKSRA